jgi:hypothetical protein
MATLASVVIQDLTYTEKSLGLGVTITYKTNGVAGAEVVTVLGHTISVSIGSSTAAQIKAAIEAHNEAKDLVTIVVSGTGSTVQKSCASNPLLGGSIALAASKQIGGILYTEKTAGVAGNSTTVAYAHHPTTLSAVATGTDIVVTFNSGVTKMSAIMATIRADSACDALVSVTQVVPDSEQLIAYAATPINLVGGADAVESSVVIQDLTFASITQNASKNGKTISYTTGATAGAEVVTVTSGNVSVQIQNGVSTATQIKTAVDLVVAFTNDYTCTVSGTGATAQKTVNAAVMSGAVGDGVAAKFVSSATLVLTTSYQAVNFGFRARQLVIDNDETTGSKTVIYSYDGITDHGVIAPMEALTLDTANANGVYLKQSGGAPAYKLMASSL